MAAGGTAVMWAPHLVLFLGFCAGAWGFLNMEELSHMKYGIEIAAEPVLGGQSKADDIVLVTSKYKQKYECRLPALAVKFHQDREDDPQSYSGQGISDLLKPMEAAPCLIKTKDWWTYELCYGKHIQQYHLEELDVKGDVLYLGYYQSEFDWNNETAKASKHHRLKRYHSQLYVNGSKCDLTGQTRETEVRFVCEEGAGDYIARIDEPQSCTYVLTVHTTRICHHPFLRPPSTATPQSIYCHPVLSPAQYVEYVKAQVTDTKRIVEEISEELKILEPKVQLTEETSPDAAEQEPSLHDGTEQAVTDNAEGDEEMTEGNLKGEDDLEDSDSDFWNKVLRPEDSLSTEGEEDVPNIQIQDDPTEGLENGVLHKVIQNPAELLKFIDELKQSVKKVKEKKSTQESAESTETTSEETPSIEKTASEDNADKTDGEDDEENQILREFEKELDDMLLPKSEMPDLKQDVKAGMENEFDNIIDETQEEMAAEGLKGEFDRKQASQYLASTLNKLLDKLNGNDPEQGADDGEEDTARGNPGPATKDNDDDSPDPRVKVRVTKVKPDSPLQKEMKVREMSQENPQLRHLENVVKDLLEKGGLKAEGKIEIKILTTGAFGDDDETHWLSEEDTKNLKDIFFNILIHGTEEVHKEERRQQKLEDNYRFVWDQNTEEAKTSSGSNAESDDLDF